MHAARAQQDKGEEDERGRALLGDARPCRRCGRVYVPRSRNQAYCTLGCRRMFGRLLKTVCRAPADEAAPPARPTRLAQFAAARAEGLSTREIAARFGVSPQRVLQVLGARKLAGGAEGA